MRTINKNTTKKYLYFLNSLKEKMDNKEITEMKAIPSLYRVSYNWCYFLIKNKIIERKDGLYYWNEKIPVSIKIINQYRRLINKKNEDYHLINKQLKVNFSDNFQSKKQKTIVFDKKEIKENLDKFSPIKREQKIGIIRKFFRWLW